MKSTSGKTRAVETLSVFQQPPRIARVAARLLLAAFAALALAGCGGGAGEYKSAPDAAFGRRYDRSDTWAIYWYICGSDLETGKPKEDGSGYTKGGKASRDIDEMLEVALPDNVTVVIETGGTKTWQSRDIDIASDANSRYVYDSGGLRAIGVLPQSAMSDEKTLEGFLRFCNENYPADHRGVIFWDHGGGSVRGIIYDEYSGRTLKLTGLRKAFEATGDPSREEPPYEFVGIDACLMATVDVAEALDGIARWMIASEETEPGCGWNYGFLDAFSGKLGMGGGHVGKAICDAFYADAEAEGVSANATLSLVNLVHVGDLLEAYKKVGTEMFSRASADHGCFGLMERAAMRSLSYGGNSEWNGYGNMVDLGDFVRNSEAAGLLEKYPAELRDALDACVAYQVKGRMMGASSGLSCYYSYNSDVNEFDKFAALKGMHPFRWLYHYRLYHEVPSEGAAYMKSLESRYGLEATDASPLEDVGKQLDGADVKFVVRDGKEVAVLGIGAGASARLASVRVDLARVGVDGDGRAILGAEYVVHDKWEDGVFSEAFSGSWAAIDGVLIYLEIRDRLDADVVFDVPALVDGERCSLVVAYFYESGEYEMLGVRDVLGEGGLPSRGCRALVPGEVIEPLYIREDDVGCRAWLPSGSVTFSDATRVEAAALPRGMYYLSFTMTDIRGNVFTTSAVKVATGE